MQTERLVVDREKARELYQEYRKHQHWSAPIDQEIQRTYRLIAQGRVVIRALESIRGAGLGSDGFPKLAIVRADATECWLDVNSHYIRFGMKRRQYDNERRQFIDLPGNALPGIKSQWDCRAIVPLIPLHLRPRRGLANYHILFEAEWSRVVPKDPMLLRRLGKGDLWLVVAAWDLTPVEQAALAARLNG